MYYEDITEGEEEIHVDMKEMNVGVTWAVQVVDEIIIKLFTIEDQPKRILDMGCGNGYIIRTCIL
jgi:tRNA1(Val) A37 N6-methylase TrmN6